MKIQQWITNGQGANVPMTPNTQLFGQNGAFRIAFQALPGTKFRLQGTGDSTEIMMGPTGIYELGFSRALIKDFWVVERVGDSNSSVMILDALIADNNDEVADPYDEALLAENYDIIEGAVIIKDDENCCCTWDISEEDSVAEGE